MRTTHPLRHLVVITLVAIAAVISTATVAPSSAHAGDYAIPYCRDGAGQPVLSLPLYDWTVDDHSAFSGYGYEKCAAGGDPITLDWSSPVTREPNTGTSWALNPAPGLTVSAWDAHAVGNIASGNTALQLSAVDPAPAPFAAPPNPYLSLCGSIDPQLGGKPCETLVLSGAFPRPATRLVFSMTCLQRECTGVSSARLGQNVVTYRDTTAPTDAGSAGSLFDSGFGAPVAGTSSITAAASDVGSGVQHIEVQIDGQTVAQSPDQCSAPYVRMVPCPLNYSTPIPVDTTKVPDGTHALQLVAQDASGERGLLRSGTIVIGNSTTVGPGADANVRGAPNGSYAADDAKLTAWWPATTRAPSKNKTVQRQCKRSKTYAAKHPILCNGRAPRRRLITTYSNKKANIIRGRLTTAAGAPISGATVNVTSVARATGATVASNGSPVTDANGQFATTIPVAGGSATVTVTWKARARDNVPATSTTLSRTVRAATTFGVSPNRVVHPGKRLTLRGTLRGQAGIRKGVTIALQVYYRGRWRTFASPRASSAGKWAFEYRFSRKAQGAYRFRAAVEQNAAYPYSAGRSSIRTIHVR